MMATDRAGRSIATRTAIIATTTRTSISVNAPADMFVRPMPPPESHAGDIPVLSQAVFHYSLARFCKSFTILYSAGGSMKLLIDTFATR